MQPNDRGLAQTVVVAALLFALVGAGVAASATLASDAPDGDEVLNDTRDRYAAAETVVIDAEVTAENRTAGESVTRSVSVAAAEGNRSRVVVEGENRSIVAGSNGTVAWRHDPATGVTVVAGEDGVRVVGPLGDGANASAAGYAGAHDATWEEDGAAPAAGVDWDRENVSVERVETTTRDGVEVHVLSITHDDEAVDGELRLWVRTADSVVVRSELRAPNATVTTTVAETAFNVSVADSTFEPPTADAAGAGAFQPVEELDDLRAAAETALATLPTDADDVAFERGAVSSVGGETTLLARYDVGGDAVTLVQSADGPPPSAGEDAETVTVGDRTAKRTTDGDRTVVWWERDGATVAVVVDADPDRALAIAERVDPGGG